MSNMSPKRAQYNGVVERIGQDAVQELRDHADGKLRKPLTRGQVRDQAMVAMLHYLCGNSVAADQKLDEVLKLAADSNAQIRDLRSNPLLKFFRNHPRISITGLAGSVAAVATAIAKVAGLF